MAPARKPGSPRWGDYTAIDIDPTDDTTFWYINEYVPTTSSIGWRLRIGAFNVVGATPVPHANGVTVGHSNGNCYADLYSSGLPIHVYDRHGSDRSR